MDLLKSRTGSIESSTWSTSSLSNARTMWNIPSTAWMWERKAFPRPSPWEAPLIKPAISVTWRYAGYMEGGFQRSQRKSYTQSDRLGYQSNINTHISDVRHCTSRFIGLNCAKWVIFCRSILFGEEIEQ